MMIREQHRAVARRTRRAARSRAKIRGTAERPRLSVFRSLQHIRAQLIDDVQGRTLIAVSDTSIKATGAPLDRARSVGKTLAEQARQKGITRVVFDRGPYQYHGRVKALAEGAREGGLIL